MAKTERLRIWLRRLAKGALFLVLGLTLLVGLALLSINFAPVSRMIAARVNAALEPTFRGRLVLHRLGHLDFGGISGAELEVHDPGGQSVLYARDIDVRLFWPRIAWDAVVGGAEPLLIPIDRIALDSVHVTVIDDGAGTPTLAHAFEPKEPPTEEKSAGTELRIDDLVVQTIAVRGSLPSVGPIDADFNDLDAELTNGPRGTHLVLEHLDVMLRQLPRVDTLSGRLTADVTLPSEAPVAPGRSTDGDNPADNAAGTPTTAAYALTPAPGPRRIVAGFMGMLAGSSAKRSTRRSRRSRCRLPRSPSWCRVFLQRPRRPSRRRWMARSTISASRRASARRGRRSTRAAGYAKLRHARWSPPGSTRPI
jgi:hypothetical protein